MHDVVCFHCQQSAEKYLKAMLNEQRLPVPRTHNLEDLISLLPSHRPLVALRQGLKILSRYAVEVRYPGLRATKRQAASALQWAGKVQAACRLLLGIRPRRHK